MSARVLVVDDIPANVKLLETKLAREYYEVISATSGQEALDKIASETPDIVLLDIMMPGMDGFEVCRRIRSNPVTAHIPVVMVTALSDITARVEGLKSGADDFLTKPVNDVALLSRMRSLIRLKMLMDEWRLREATSSELGLKDSINGAEPESSQHANLLLIDNDAAELNKVEKALAEDNHKFTRVSSCDDGRKKLEEETYDLIICNLNNPNEDPLRFCSYVRSQDKTRHTPILLLSNGADLSLISKALEIGVNDYVVRPVDKNELLARCRSQIRRRRYQERLRTNYEKNMAMALTDALTETFNRRYVNVHLPRLLMSTIEQGKPMAGMFIDIDHFKIVNDTYGHPVGDQVLKELARRITIRLRSFDLISRMGGEEFLVVMLDTDTNAAKDAAERLRLSVADEKFKTDAPEGKIPITVSIGVTLARKDDTVETFLKRVDDAMYMAKKSGRNRIEFLD